MPQSPNQPIQERLLALNAQAWGISVGLLFGGGLFLATNLLVIKGGPLMGRHLTLLGQFFPGIE